MSLILDITSLSCGHTDDALEFLHKAISDGGDAIWDPHPSPLVRKLIELFTSRGLDRLQAVRVAMADYMTRRASNGGVQTPRPPGSMERWGPEELKLVRVYLEKLPPSQWTFGDHMMMVDYVVQKYLPQHELKSEAEWLATRSILMGRVQANLEKVAEKKADKLAAALPLTAEAAAQKFELTAPQREMLDYANAHAAENVRAFTDDARHKLRALVIRHAHNRARGMGYGSIETELLDTFATLNRDWRRIAVTESGEALNQGLIASIKPGQQVKRVEQYRGACPFCRRIDGVIATVVSPDKKDKDGETEIWVGKDNVGRSAALNKRVGDKLVPRSKEELWHLPAGLAHPNCRGRWVPVIQPLAGDDPDFHKWMVETLNPNVKK